MKMKYFIALPIAFIVALSVYHYVPDSWTRVSEPVQSKRETARPAPAPTAYPLSVETTPSTWKGHYERFGFSGSTFRLPAPATGGGESDVFDFKAVDGSVWSVDLHLFFDGEDNLYAVRVSSDPKKGCGLQLPEFDAIPKKCVVEEQLIISTKAKRWFRKKFGSRLYKEQQAMLEEEYPD